ncbi:short-chain fatty acid transporter [Propioniciclava coleopterorum]|uniref:Short-chain fatty acid transporter n=1 Tax=Propioniciclava coleopterorum TaxID=2714937 RepID=A0A6G7YAP8_9ACTN|nr:TIGR00366 family protein [Propioniciclava coleopterorum]QIK73687.1 short-chain fatty acid transporter [Propioniciclava coleopterorum]
MTTSTDARATKRGPILRIADATNSFVHRFLPDPYVIGALLIAVIFLWGIVATPTTPAQMMKYFGDGAWSLVGFAMQLSVVIVTSQALANTPPVARVLARVATVPKTPAQAALFVALFTAAISVLNWGVGFVAGVILAREISRRMTGAHFPLLAAAAYAGYTVWSGGLSSSIPLTLNTKGHPLEKMTGQVPLTETIFSPTNIAVVVAMAIAYALVARFMTPSKAEAVGLPPESPEAVASDEPEKKEGTFASMLEHSRVLSIGLGVLGLVWFVMSVATGGLNALNLNLVNLLILSLGLMLYKGVVPYLRAAEDAGRAIIPIVIIYPLYAAISSMITNSGLGEIMTQFFAGIANAQTLPVITFLTAGLINVFVPADGGHLVLQGPIFLELAQQFGADRGMVVTAMAMGANWTNLLQPFWALPLLAIARLGIRDIMGYCFVMLVAGGLVACLVFGIAPLIL